MENQLKIRAMQNVIVDLKSQLADAKKPRELTDCEKSLRDSVNRIARHLSGESESMVDDNGDYCYDYFELDESTDSTLPCSHLVSDVVAIKNHGKGALPEQNESGSYTIGDESFDTVYLDIDGNLLTGGEEFDLNPESGFDYIKGALDIEYTVDSSGEYLGANVLVTFGGPDITIDTRHNVVRGAWWGDSFTASYRDEIGVDEACAEIFQC